MTLLPITGPGRLVAGDGRAFVVVEHEGRWHVVDADCPHNRGPLEHGRIRDGLLVCPSHWYRFDLETGECDVSPQHRLGVYPVVERDGVRYADVGDPPAPLSWSERLRAHARGE